MAKQNTTPARYVLVDETSRELVYGSRDQETVNAAEYLSYELGDNPHHTFCLYRCPEDLVLDQSGNVVYQDENLKRWDDFLKARDRNQAEAVLFTNEGKFWMTPEFQQELGITKFPENFIKHPDFPERNQTGYIAYSEFRDQDLTLKHQFGPFYDPREAEDAFTDLLDSPADFDSRTLNAVQASAESGYDRPTCEYSLRVCSDVLAGDPNWEDAAYLSPERMNGSYTCFFNEDGDTGYPYLEGIDLVEWHYSPEFLDDFARAGEQPQYKDYMENTLAEREEIFAQEEQWQIQVEQNRKEDRDEWIATHGHPYRTLEPDETEPDRPERSREPDLRHAISRGAEAHDQKKNRSGRKSGTRQPKQKGTVEKS